LKSFLHDAVRPAFDDAEPDAGHTLLKHAIVRTLAVTV
jgi:hypothetical protein